MAGRAPRVHWAIGGTLLLVCHNAQAYNHRNRANVAMARQMTARSRAIQELDAASETDGLAWALNVVHWVGGEPTTRTFRVSYQQLRYDFPGDVSVAAGIGYNICFPRSLSPDGHQIRLSSHDSSAATPR